ncbi:MAG TPA: hypothetical protein VGQ09_15455 [Chitinophagaceae bacterium]|jgi:hypothetical protein|nr:hypothetical protein [Chitinophagaceae bacterium]
METHAHHIHKAPGTGWKHYFVEFFMLFLAVFCGFLAENFRETSIERNREKQFVLSVAEDLKLDILDLDDLAKKRQIRAGRIDSLFLMLNSSDPNIYGNDIYYFARLLTYNTAFINNDRTVQELKNSGNFRLISKQQVSDSIMYYDQRVRSLILIYGREEVFTENYITMLSDYFDSRVFNEMLKKDVRGVNRPTGNPRLLSTENKQLQKLLTAIHFFKAINIAITDNLNRLKHEAESLLQFIQKEYHLK